MILLDLLGTFVFALVGAVKLAERGSGLLAVALAGFCTAVGGGTLREMLLNDGQLFWLENPLYPVVIVAAIFCASSVLCAGRWLQLNLRMLDSLSVVVFLCIGVQASMRCGVSVPIAVLLGTLTGIGGGLIRDAALGEALSTGEKPILVLLSLINAALLTLLLLSSMPVWQVLLMSGAIQILVIESMHHLSEYRPTGGAVLIRSASVRFPQRLQ